MQIRSWKACRWRHPPEGGSAAQELFGISVRQLGPSSTVIDGLHQFDNAIGLPLREAHTNKGLLASIVGHMDVLHRLASGLGEPCGYISLDGGLAHEIVGLAMVSRVLGIEQDVGTDLSDITNRHAVVGLGGFHGSVELAIALDGLHLCTDVLEEHG